MKSTSSDPVSGAPDSRKYFCTEPWTGIFSIETNQGFADVLHEPHLLGGLDQARIEREHVAD